MSADAPTSHDAPPTPRPAAKAMLVLGAVISTLLAVFLLWFAITNWDDVIAALAALAAAYLSLLSWVYAHNKDPDIHALTNLGYVIAVLAPLAAAFFSLFSWACIARLRKRPSWRVEGVLMPLTMGICGWVLSIPLGMVTMGLGVGISGVIGAVVTWIGVLFLMLGLFFALYGLGLALQKIFKRYESDGRPRRRRA